MRQFDMVTGSQLRRYASVLAIIVASGVVLMLALEVRALRLYEGEVRRLRAFPHVGQWVPTVRVRTLAGDSVTIGETSAGRAQVMIVLTTTCEFCRASLEHWKRLSSALTSDSEHRYDVYWVSGSSWDSTRVYAERHKLPPMVVKMPSTKMLRASQIKSVPMTLVLDHFGRVAYVHPSVFDNQAAVDSVLTAARRAAAPGKMDSGTVALVPQR